MLGSMLAATLLKIVALPVPLLRQVPREPPGEGKTIVFFDFLEDGAENKVLRHAKTLVFFDFLVR